MAYQNRNEGRIRGYQNGHASEVYSHGYQVRITEVRYISEPLDAEGLKDIEDAENELIANGFQPFGKPFEVRGLMVQKMIRRA